MRSIGRRASDADLGPSLNMTTVQPAMKMKTSPDNRGREWLYLDTDEPELLAAFPRGTPYVKMRFGSVFRLIAEDPRFWGLFINRTHEYHYLIPREVFGDVRKVLDSDPSWEKIPVK